MNQNIKTGLGVAIILVMAFTAGYFVWQVERVQRQPLMTTVDKAVPMPEKIQKTTEQLPWGLISVVTDAGRGVKDYYTIDENGKRLREVAHQIESGSDRAVELSPDKKFLAHLDSRDEFYDSEWKMTVPLHEALVVEDYLTGVRIDVAIRPSWYQQEKEASAGRIVEYEFSRNGQYIAYAIQESDGRYSLHTFHLPTRQDTTVTSTEVAYSGLSIFLPQITWLPDSSGILVVDGDRLRLVSTSGVVRTLTDHVGWNDWQDMESNWSKSSRVDGVGVSPNSERAYIFIGKQGSYGGAPESSRIDAVDISQATSTTILDFPKSSTIRNNWMSMLPSGKIWYEESLIAQEPLDIKEYLYDPTTQQTTNVFVSDVYIGTKWGSGIMQGFTSDETGVFIKRSEETEEVPAGLYIRDRQSGTERLFIAGDVNLVP